MIKAESKKNNNNKKHQLIDKHKNIEINLVKVNCPDDHWSFAFHQIMSIIIILFSSSSSSSSSSNHFISQSQLE